MVNGYHKMTPRESALFGLNAYPCPPHEVEVVREDRVRVALPTTSRSVQQFPHANVLVRIKFGEGQSQGDSGHYWKIARGVDHAGRTRFDHARDDVARVRVRALYSGLTRRQLLRR